MKFIKFKSSDFVLEPRYYFYGWKISSEMKARPSVVAALKKAKRLLPKGYTLKLWDTERNYKTQILMSKSFAKRLILMYKNKNIPKLLARYAGSVSRRVLRLDTHRNGGALDVAIVNDRGAELYMGTDHDDLTEKATLWYYEKKKKLSIFEREARKNRLLLARVMKMAGFREYAPEWWHWSYET